MGWKLLADYTEYKALWYAVTASLVLGALSVATLVVARWTGALVPAEGGIFLPRAAERPPRQP